MEPRGSLKETPMWLHMSYHPSQTNQKTHLHPLLYTRKKRRKSPRQENGYMMTLTKGAKETHKTNRLGIPSNLTLNQTRSRFWVNSVQSSESLKYSQSNPEIISFFLQKSQQKISEMKQNLIPSQPVTFKIWVFDPSITGPHEDWWRKKSQINPTHHLPHDDQRNAGVSCRRWWQIHQIPSPGDEFRDCSLITGLVV